LADETIKKRQFSFEKFEKERIEKLAEEERKRKAYKERAEQTDETADHGDINLSFFKRIDRSTQFLIACGLMAVMFTGLYLCMFALNKKPVVLKKKNK